jgi:hypothetical protein
VGQGTALANPCHGGADPDMGGVVLISQRVTPAALARALPAAHAGSGRARLTHVRRWWTGPVSDQAVVSPQLIAGALALLAPGQAVVVALGTTLLLLQRLQGAFPVGVRWSLVADRGVPSAALFAQLRHGARDFSVQLRLSDRLTVAGV